MANISVEDEEQSSNINGVKGPAFNGQEMLLSGLWEQITCQDKKGVGVYSITILKLRYIDSGNKRSFSPRRVIYLKYLQNKKVFTNSPTPKGPLPGVDLYNYKSQCKSTLKLEFVIIRGKRVLGTQRAMSGEFQISKRTYIQLELFATC